MLIWLETVSEEEFEDAGTNKAFFKQWLDTTESMVAEKLVTTKEMKGHWGLNEPEPEPEKPKYAEPAPLAGYGVPMAQPAYPQAIPQAQPAYPQATPAYPQAQPAMMAQPMMAQPMMAQPMMAQPAMVRSTRLLSACRMSNASNPRPHAPHAFPPHLRVSYRTPPRMPTVWRLSHGTACQSRMPACLA